MPQRLSIEWYMISYFTDTSLYGEYLNVRSDSIINLHNFVWNNYYFKRLYRLIITALFKVIDCDHGHNNNSLIQIRCPESSQCIKYTLCEYIIIPIFFIFYPLNRTKVVRYIKLCLNYCVDYPI